MLSESFQSVWCISTGSVLCKYILRRATLISMTHVLFGYSVSCKLNILVGYCPKTVSCTN